MNQDDDPTSTALPGVTVTIRSVPADKMRDVLKAAVLPLATKADITVDMTITATGDGDGTPRNTVELTVAEALRQLELDSTIHEHDQSGD